MAAHQIGKLRLKLIGCVFEINAENFGLFVLVNIVLKSREK